MWKNQQKHQHQCPRTATTTSGAVEGAEEIEKGRERVETEAAVHPEEPAETASSNADASPEPVGTSVEEQIETKEAGKHGAAATVEAEAAVSTTKPAEEVTAVKKEASETPIPTTLSEPAKTGKAKPEEKPKPEKPTKPSPQQNGAQVRKEEVDLSEADVAAGAAAAVTAKEKGKKEEEEPLECPCCEWLADVFGRRNRKKAPKGS
ncbi:expressed unknown protein [Seminavis robusta]|uniref:Uncharacterized protein n=1 Tax=Seminavis robusta TaxID=568900 RepID=A0A9N8H6G9_9STRA|nr:expressed unknown protein [Seminavis robusta]|eukprot:Sro171_g075610.1 n/a (206) ;mRNA; f:3755-4372